MDDLLRARWSGPVIVSYAQNGEDVRLWRAFGGTDTGYYVDVGAGDPVTNSVTKLFSDAGWSGINIEPGPDFEELRRARPRDVNLQVAIACEPGATELWVSSPDPGLSSFVRPDDALLPPGYTVARTTVRKDRLTNVLEQHAADREIDFLKVDVEGAEREVFESVDLRVFRPRVIVAEAISPLEFRQSHDDWEPLLVASGYVPACFDGLNRFYVRDDSQALIPALDYPVTILDRYVLHDRQWRRDSSMPDEQTRPRAPIEWDRSHERSARAEAFVAKRQLEEIHATLSWRVTRPLRAFRGLQRRGRQGSPGRLVGVEGLHGDAAAHLEAACARRLLQATSVLDGGDGLDAATRSDNAVSFDEAASQLEVVIEATQILHHTKAWVVLTAVDGRYPDDETLDAIARMLRSPGSRKLREFLRRRLAEALGSGTATDVGLDIVRDSVVVVSDAIVSSDIHTGIQRVARECISRWLRTPRTRLASYDSGTSSLRLLSASEHERIRSWRDHLPDSGSEIRDRSPQLASDAVLVPWNCRLVVAELPFERRFSRALATIARAGVSQTLSFIGFDLVPVVAPETADPGVSDAYCHYLGAVKRAAHISAISEQSARGFQAYVSMLDAEGLDGPVVRAHRLPVSAPPFSDQELVGGAATLRLEGLPLVLVVGVHVPRKNHIAVLEAAERLWLEGRAFELLFIGGIDQTSGNEFDGYVEQLRTHGWPVRVLRRVSEAELWAAFAAARFSVYLSLLEGFGLPIAESLASGTPVITSSHGSMAEVAAGGGALLVDPLDIDAVTAQMRALLTDDDLVERLRREARDRDLGNWDDYAREVWEFFTGEASPR